MTLIVCTWLWGSKYDESYVDKLRAGVLRNLKQDHRFFVARPELSDVRLTKIPGCFCRLRMFDSAWQITNGLDDGDRLVCLDLDVVITGHLDPLFDRPDSFVILGGANGKNPCPFNGSVMMLRAGAHEDVWSQFSLERASRVPFHEFPDDQGWIWSRIPEAATWKCGAKSGVWAFQKRGWPIGGDALPQGARIVAFPGRRDPSQFTHLPWVREHWCC